MSRWLAVFDQEGRINPEENRNAFRCYPHFQAEALTELHCDNTSWLGIFGPGAYSGPSGVSVLWDGADYNTKTAGEEPLLLSQAWLDGDRRILDRLNGRWSFLLFDSPGQKLWLARDRVGVKPLYYWRGSKRLVFASEPKLILSLPFVEKGFDPEAVFDYFVLNRVDVQRETLFKEIRQILPAHEMTVDLQKHKMEERRYYDLPFEPSVGKFTPSIAEEYKKGIRQLLGEAVGNRLRYHSSPPATLLSGGLDSSTLACLLREASSEKVTALTASYHEKAFAEQQWAKIVADRINARWLQTFPTVDGLRDDLRTFIFSQDTPTYSAGTYSQFCLFRLAREENVPIVFDGQGADALFAGHLTNLPPLWRDLFFSGQWKSLVREWRAFGPIWKAWAFGGLDWLKNSGMPSLPGGFQQLFKRWYFPEWQFLNPDLIEANLGRYQTVPAPGAHSLNHTLRRGYFGGPLSFLLKCVDRASSWAGVETCTPYSDDPELMEYVFSIPGSYKIRQGASKWLLRESCKDILPAEIYGRQNKMGLVTPNNAWMAQLRPVVRAYLEEQDEAIFNKKVLLQEMDRFFNPESPHENYRVYKYLSMVIWRSVFNI